MAEAKEEAPAAAHDTAVYVLVRASTKTSNR